MTPTYTTFRIDQAAKLSGLSVPMVDYLCRQGIVVPSGAGSYGRGRGKHRRYTFSDVALLRTYGRLLNEGVSVKRLKEAHKSWKNHFKQLDGQTPPNRFLLTDGQRVYFVTAQNVLTELTSNPQLAFGFIVDLNKVHDDMIERQALLFAGKL